MDIKEFRGRFVFTKRREELLRLFLDEMKTVRSQCERVRVLVFGSFITGKEEPADMDVLLSILPNRDNVYRLYTSTLEREHPREIDVQYVKSTWRLRTAESLLAFFNRNPINVKKGVRVTEAVELTGLVIERDGV
ncbi:MAG TPA: hypothetical protein ENN21_06465 [Spirochaetes bacterium]|nr:hypothetical protein [Spirochaetota bacterium]